MYIYCRNVKIFHPMLVNCKNIELIFRQIFIYGKKSHDNNIPLHDKYSVGT